MSLLKDLSVSAIVAGFVTVLVGFTSSGAIVFQAANSLGATPEEVGSWLWALGVGMGVTCVGLSLRYKAPLATAWSTTGAALLITTGQSGVTMSEAVGAFILSAVLITIAGFSGWFERIMNRIPMSIAAGMLAGILLRFGIDVFEAMGTQFAMVFAMFCVYLVSRQLIPRYSVIAALAVGTVIAGAQGLLHTEGVVLELAMPVIITPVFTLDAFIGVALPLFVVTMASQNIPGVAAVRAGGYTEVPVSPVVGWTGVTTLVLAPLGAFALNLATLTAAICTGREAHADPDKRYVAAVAAGVFYFLVGLVGATVGSIFAAFPEELVLGIAGLALFGPIANGLAAAMKHEDEREPALITFLVTASGLTLFGVGSSFWGLIAGALTLLLFRFFRPRT